MSEGVEEAKTAPAPMSWSHSGTQRIRVTAMMGWSNG